MLFEVELSYITSDADVAMIKGTFQDVFADKTNVVDVLNAQGNTASSFTNEQFNLSITGTNVNLETINTSYDRLQSNETKSAATGHRLLRE